MLFFSFINVAEIIKKNLFYKNIVFVLPFSDAQFNFIFLTLYFVYLRNLSLLSTSYWFKNTFPPNYITIPRLESGQRLDIFHHCFYIIILFSSILWGYSRTKHFGTKTNMFLGISFYYAHFQINQCCGAPPLFRGSGSETPQFCVPAPVPTPAYATNQTIKNMQKLNL